MTGGQNVYVECHRSDCVIILTIYVSKSDEYRGIFIMFYAFIYVFLFLQQPFYGPLSGTTRVSRYQKKHSPTHHPDHHPVFISFFHLPQSIASFLFKLRAWQSFCTTSLHVLFGLPLGLEPSTSYSVHFFTKSVSSFRRTCPYHRTLFFCTLTLHIHLTILIYAG